MAPVQDRANDILDNLLAQRKTEPFLVVMPLGYGGAPVNGDGTGVPPKGAGTFGGDAALYKRDLLEDIIPMIDKKYRTTADRKHRAIVGFSMGGGQAGRFGLRHLETFSQVGIMSAGMAGGPDTEPLATLAANPARANKEIDLLWIACGKDDTAMKGAKTLHHALEQARNRAHVPGNPKARTTGACGGATCATSHHCCSSRCRSATVGRSSRP